MPTVIKVGFFFGTTLFYSHVPHVLGNNYALTLSLPQNLTLTDFVTLFTQYFLT